MNSLPAIPDSFQPNFDQMWSSACRVCDSIRAFQPDLLLVLMHSGWGPVFAAQVLWTQTQSLPFPPMVRTNIGREKIGIFDETFNLLTTDYFVGEYSTDIDVGKLLAWVALRSDWQAQLRQQVAEVMQTAEGPQRILVVDDTIHEGSTTILTLSLLDKLYPQAEVRLLNADSWFRDTYMDLMLALYPIAAAFPDGKIPSDEVNRQLGRVAIGSENISDDSLFWQPISLASPSVQALSVYLPAADWVQFSQAIYPLIAQYIAGRSASYTPNQPNPAHYSFGLRAEWLVMRDIWLENGITRRQVEQRYGLSGKKAKRLLERWMEFNELAIEGHGRWARYVIPLPLQRYMDKLEDRHDELHEAYWVLPGRLMFGDRPWYTDNPDSLEWARQEVRQLLAHGVDGWLDVQIVQQGEAPKENPLFLPEAQAIGRTAIAKTIPLAIKYVREDNAIRTRRGRPNRKDIRQVLDQIDQLLADGRILYVSTSGDELRSILAGCYLARHGTAGKAALTELQACRATGGNGWKREPATYKARRYVRSWPAGL